MKFYLIINYYLNFYNNSSLYLSLLLFDCQKIVGLENLFEFFYVKRLRQDLVHACLQTLLLVTVHDVASDSDYNWLIFFIQTVI